MNKSIYGSKQSIKTWVSAGIGVAKTKAKAAFCRSHTKQTENIKKRKRKKVKLETHKHQYKGFSFLLLISRGQEALLYISFCFFLCSLINLGLIYTLVLNFLICIYLLLKFNSFFNIFRFHSI